MATVDKIATEVGLDDLRARNMSPVYVQCSIIGTAHSIAGHDLVNLTINSTLRDGIECILLPPLEKGSDISKDIIKELHQKVKFEDLLDGEATSYIRPVRAIYVHDMRDAQDETQHQQLSYAVGLTGRGHDKVVRLVRFGPPPDNNNPEDRIKRIRDRWRHVFMNRHKFYARNNGPMSAERGAEDQNGFCNGPLDDLIRVKTYEAVRFVKQLKLKGDLYKTDLWKEVD